MLFYGLLSSFLIASIVLYQLSIKSGEKNTLFIYFFVSLITASLIYYILIRHFNRYVITSYPLFLPIITSIRVREESEQKKIEKQMRSL